MAEQIVAHAGKTYYGEVNNTPMVFKEDAHIDDYICARKVDVGSLAEDFWVLELGETPAILTNPAREQTYCGCCPDCLAEMTTDQAQVVRFAERNLPTEKFEWFRRSFAAIANFDAVEATQWLNALCGLRFTLPSDVEAIRELQRGAALEAINFVARTERLVS